MKFNAFNFITPSIDDVKKLLFPISKSKWMKLGFISMFAGGGSGGFNMPRGNFNFGGNSDISNSMNEITGDAINNHKEGLGVLYYIVFPIVLLVVLFGLIMTYITSVFSFMFIEALETKKVLIKKSWHNNKSLGFSFFLFRIIIGFFVLGMIVLLALPLIIPLIQQGATTYFENFSLWNIAWIIPAILCLIIFFIVMSVFMSLVFNFSLVHMYYKKTPAWASIKTTFKNIGQNKLATFIFLLAKMIVDIVCVAAALIVALLLIIPMLIIAIPFILIFVLLIIQFGWTISIIVGMAVVILVYMFFYVYLISVLFLPMATFARYFSIRNYKALMK
jgi:hypothetical protein